MLSKIKSGFIWVLALASGILALVLGIQTQRAKNLKAEADGAKKDALKASEHLQRADKIIKDAEAKRQTVLQTEATLDNIKAETEEAVRTAQEIKKGDTVRFGKFIFIFALLFTQACAPTFSDCRTTYPCPENICVPVTPPKIEVLPRPELTQLDVAYSERTQAYLLTTEQIKALAGNERVLIETIKGYEKIIAAYTAWRLKQ